MAHALLSPSSMDRIISCPASLAQSDGEPNNGNRFAWEGTAAHTLASWCLEQARTALSFIGEKIKVIENDVEVAEYEVDEEMAGHVQEYVDRVYAYMSVEPSAELYVEQEVNFSEFAGVDPELAFGTSDAIIVFPQARRIHVNDYKHGKGVQVFASYPLHAVDENGKVIEAEIIGEEPNAQMASYALGAISTFEQVYGEGYFTEITMTIHQPRLGHVSEFTCSVAALKKWALLRMLPGCNKALMLLELKRQGNAIALEHYNPDPLAENCRFCKGKATCPALRNTIQDALGCTFEDLDADIAELDDKPAPIATPDEDAALDALYPKLDMIIEWAKAVYAKINARHLSGMGDAYKTCYLKVGKKGPREWADEKKAEADLKSMRLKQEEMYTMKVISPTQAEKTLKDAPKRWKRLQSNIKQAPGKPTLAGINEKGERYQVPTLFTDLDAEGVDDLA